METHSLSPATAFCLQTVTSRSRKVGMDGVKPVCKADFQSVGNHHASLVTNIFANIQVLILSVHASVSTFLDSQGVVCSCWRFRRTLYPHWVFPLHYLPFPLWAYEDWCDVSPPRDEGWLQGHLTGGHGTVSSPVTAASGQKFPPHCWGFAWLTCGSLGKNTRLWASNVRNNSRTSAAATVAVEGSETSLLLLKSEYRSVAAWYCTMWWGGKILALILPNQLRCQEQKHCISSVLCYFLPEGKYDQKQDMCSVLILLSYFLRPTVKAHRKVTLQDTQSVLVATNDLYPEGF